MDATVIMNDIQHFIVNNIISGDVTIEKDTVLEDAGIDSFSIVEIILFIERKYGLVMPNEELLPENFKTVRAVSEVVQRLLN